MDWNRLEEAADWRNERKGVSRIGRASPTPSRSCCPQEPRCVPLYLWWVSRWAPRWVGIPCGGLRNAGWVLLVCTY